MATAKEELPIRFAYQETRSPKYAGRPPITLSPCRSATVQLNYHVAIDFQNYSLPYEYVKKKVDVRYTHSSIEIFYKCTRICSHKRLYGRRGQYSTVIDHMPAKEAEYQAMSFHERMMLLVDSILDRIIPFAYTMKIDGDVSMRQRKRVVKD